MVLISVQIKAKIKKKVKSLKKNHNDQKFWFCFPILTPFQPLLR